MNDIDRKQLNPKYWEVEVRIEGEHALTIGHSHLAGMDNIADYADTVQLCADHLLAFIGRRLPNECCATLHGDITMTELPNCKLCGSEPFRAIDVKCNSPKCSLCDTRFSEDEWQTLMGERVEEVEPVRFTHDGALAECPCCSSLDVGAAGNTAHCYGCGLSITKFSHQEALDAWNTRAKRIVQPTGESK